MPVDPDAPGNIPDPNLVLNAGPGELFVVRNIANIVPPFGRHLANRSVGAAIEYAIHFLKVPHVIICGHTQCGGLQALAEGPSKLEAETPTLAAWLQDALVVRERISSRWEGASQEAIVRQLVFENVVVQLENLLTYPVIQKALEENRVEIHGWVYDLASTGVEDVWLGLSHNDTRSWCCHSGQRERSPRWERLREWGPILGARSRRPGRCWARTKHSRHC